MSNLRDRFNVHAEDVRRSVRAGDLRQVDTNRMYLLGYLHGALLFTTDSEVSKEARELSRELTENWPMVTKFDQDALDAEQLITKKGWMS